jgi:hypothetical protein
VSTVALGHVEANVVQVFINFLGQFDREVDLAPHRQEDLGVESPGGVIQTTAGTLAPPFALHE